MSKTKAAAKKTAKPAKPAAPAAAKKTASPAKGAAPDVKAGSQVTYVLSDHDAKMLGRPAGSTMAMTVDVVRGTGEVLLSKKIATKGIWRRGAYYDATGARGTWH